MAVKLRSPHPFPERFLLFGGGGAGKTNVVLNIASHLAEGTMHVLDSDFSSPYKRALATEYTDCADRVNLTIADIEWDAYANQFADTVTKLDVEHDWLVMDPISRSYDAVQSWYVEQVYGHDLATHIIQLRKTYADDLKAFHKALSESMDWNVIKKEYLARIWRPISKWHGHLIMCAEAKELGSRENDETRSLYGPIGYKPAGQALMMHVGATNLFLDHPRRSVWRMTTIKDRNREELDKAVIEDFGMDYLVEVAGWEPVRRRKADA